MSRRAHPRSRGENAGGRVSRVGARGSSPLTRGKRLLTWATWRSQGLIPAHAGKTGYRWGPAAQQSAHPRSRGENGLHDRCRSHGDGSSPLTRGKRPDADGGGRAERLIPAHAGKTRVTPTRVGSSTAHPRSRGENTLRVRRISCILGSSPLTRGKPRSVLSSP